MNVRKIGLWALLGLFGVWMPQLSQAQEDKITIRTYTLEEIVRLSISRNPRLEKRKAVVEATQGQLAIAEAYPNPTLGVESGYSTFRDSSTSISTLERSVTVRQPLEWNPKRQARMQAALEGVDAARKGQDEAHLQVRADTETAFYGLLKAKKLSKLALRNQAIVEELQHAVKSRVDAGEAPPFDEIKIKVELLRVQKESFKAHSSVRTARSSLNALTAGALQSPFSIQGEFPTGPVTLDVVIASKSIGPTPDAEKNDESP